MTAADIWPITAAVGMSSLIAGGVGALTSLYSRGKMRGEQAAMCAAHKILTEENCKRIGDGASQRALIKAEVIAIDKSVAVLAEKVDGIARTTSETHEMVLALTKRR